MQYIIVTPHQIDDLRAAMDLFEQLWDEDIDEHALYIYGMVQGDPSLIAPLEEAVREENDLHEAVKIETAIIVIPVSSDTLYYLTGSGLILKNESFSYLSNKEIRTSSLGWSSQEPRATLSSFSKIALSANDFHAEDFLKWEGSAALGAGSTETKRTEKITEPGEPQLGGISEHGGATAKESSFEVAEEPNIITKNNIEDLSTEELFELRSRLVDQNGNLLFKDSDFVWFEASSDSGYLIQTDVPQEAFTFIAKSLNLDPDEVEAESSVMSGQELVEYIDSLLGE